MICYHPSSVLQHCLVSSPSSTPFREHRSIIRVARGQDPALGVHLASRRGGRIPLEKAEGKAVNQLNRCCSCSRRQRSHRQPGSKACPRCTRRGWSRCTSRPCRRCGPSSTRHLLGGNVSQLEKEVRWKEFLPVSVPSSHRFQQ